MSITSFDHFIETLDHVPAELHRNFNLMADLDKRISEMIRRINDCVQEYRRAERKDDRVSLSKESMDLFDKARLFSDEKIDLATATYDLVDKHIRRLEGLKGAQAVFGGEVNSNSSANHRNNVSFSGAGAGGTSTGAGGGNSKNVKKEKKDGDGLSFFTKEPSLAVDMPLDPNEPKYCTCHQVSFGEMIACDNKDCPVEWFHFACVELKAKPKGKWYCPECFNINKKGKHKVKKLKIC